MEERVFVLSKGRCVFMYIKKSIITGMIMVLGGIILLTVAIVFCFTEVTVSRYVCLAVWLVCIRTVSVLTKKVERM